MSHAIIRRADGRRHDVDFGGAPLNVEIFTSEETVEIVVEIENEACAPKARRFALLNIPRSLLSEALGADARRKGHAKGRMTT
jgi:hypothetical protein